MALELDGLDDELVRRGIRPEVIAALSGRQPAAQPAQPAASFVQPGSRDYNLRVGTTSQPGKPSFVGPQPGAENAAAAAGTAPALEKSFSGSPSLSFANPQPAQPAGNPADPMNKGAQPVSFVKRYEDLQAQEPTRAQFPAEKMPMWRKILGSVASVAAGAQNPNAAGASERALLNAPQRKADEKFEQAHQQWAGQEAGVVKEAGLANLESEIKHRDDAPDKPQLDDITKEFSDALAKGDQGRIDALQPRVKQYMDTTQKPTQPKEDKKIDEFVDPKNNRVNVMQRTDGTTYNVIRGQQRAEGGAPGGQADDVALTARGIMNGDQPPDTKSFYRNTMAVRAELERHGYNLMRAEQDWQATQKYLATLNGAQQTRLRQAVGFTKDSLSQVEDIYNEWLRVGASSGWKTFNKISLGAAKQLPGAPGELAHRLEARVADLTSELGTVYKGGNSSTDESLRLAAQNLGSDWNEQTFKNAIKDIRESIRIRENSMKNLQPAGVSEGNAYTPPATKGEGGGQIIKYDKDGNRTP